MRIRISVFLLTATQLLAADKAKNVIVFLADAAGLPTIHAASLHGYDAPQKLYIQSWPQIALSDTSPANSWVTDSAAGMTAIVTGVKTNNNVVSQGPDAIYSRQDGRPLKTILEYAEERGLSTGVVTNVSIADATPAATYAHSNNRTLQGDIFLQLFTPRYGDGADVVIGGGRVPIFSQIQAAGKNAEQSAAAKGRKIYESVAAVPATDSRPIVVTNAPVDMREATMRALDLLSKNRKGYFLMIEWDAHTDNPKAGLDNLVAFDRLIREIASKVNLKETLLLFTADHSFEFHTTGGSPGVPILTGWDQWSKSHQPQEPISLPAVRVGHGHTGEEVLVTAQGPGSEQVKGFLPNTQLFHIMMRSLGWKPDR